MIYRCYTKHYGHIGSTVIYLDGFSNTGHIGFTVIYLDGFSNTSTSLDRHVCYIQEIRGAIVNLDTIRNDAAELCDGLFGLVDLGEW